MEITVKKSIGETGMANVRVNKGGIVVSFDESGSAYELPLDTWEKGRAGGKYNITLSKDGTKILGVRPPAQTYIMKFEQFGNRQSDVPEPKIQQGGPRQSRDGKKRWIQPSSLVAVITLTVESEGMYKGLKAFHTIPYIFAPTSNGETRIEANGKRDLERLETFLRVCGFDLASETIPYSGNILPWLEKRLLALDTPFLATIGLSGFFDSFAMLPLELRGTTKKVSKKK